MTKHNVALSLRLIAIGLILLSGLSTWFGWFGRPATSILFVVALVLVLVSRLMGFKKSNHSHHE